MPNIIEKILKKLLIAKGFKQKKNCWYIDLVETIALIDLQKSKWGNQYYINLAINLKSILGTNLYPKENESHIRTRLTSLLSENEKLNLEKSLNLEDELYSEIQRKQLITSTIITIVMPIFENLSSIKLIKEFLIKPESKKYLIDRKVKEIAFNKTKIPSTLKEFEIR